MFKSRLSTESAKLASTPPRLTFDRTRDWAGSARAFNWWTIGIVAIWPWFIGSFSEPLPGYELPVNIHLYDLLNGFIPALVLIDFRLVFKANQPTSFSGSTLKNLGAWFIAATAGILGSLGLVSAFGPVPGQYLAGIPIGIASSFGQILAACTITIIASELRLSAKQLAQKQHALDVTKASLEDQVVGQREALKHEVESRLSGQIDALRMQLESLNHQSGGDAAIAAKSVAEKIKATIDGLVRPLSQKISEIEPESNRRQIRTIREIEKQIKRLPFLQRMALRLPLSHVFNLTFVVLYLLVFVLPSYGFLFGITGILEIGLPASMIAYGLIAAAKRFTRAIQVAYAIALVEAVIAAAIAAVPFIILGALFLPPVDQGLGLYVSLSAFLVFLASFYGALFAEAAFINLDRAKTANEELRKLVAFLQNEAQINRRAMAQLVHGKIQARLQAASIRLLQAREVNEVLLEEISRDLKAAVLDTSETSFDRSSVAEQLGEMVEQWAGICDLSFNLASGVEALVDSNPVAKSAVVEVIREAVNNAVKHGDADEAEASVALLDQGAIQVVVRNAVYSDSAEAREVQPRGYGSQVLDQITDGWNLEFEDGDAILTAKIRLINANL